jgi:hypothetical protein
MKKPLWKCPWCERQYANRNQSHSCIDITVAEHLRGKNEELIKVYRAFEAAVLRCGDVRIHAQQTRLAFIARMTFSGASFQRDHLEAGVMLPYRSLHPRFHNFLPNKHGGVHYFKLRKPADVDAEVIEWVREAFRCGMQESGSPALSSDVQTAALPKRSGKQAGRTTPARIFYIHWNEAELDKRCEPLRRAGHEVRGHWDASNVAKLGDFVPDIFIISLDRMPSHGRAHAGWFWGAKKRQAKPIIFEGGEPEKTLVAKHQFPQAYFCATREVADVVRAITTAER